MVSRYTGAPMSERMSGLVLFGLLAALAGACTIGVPRNEIVIRRPREESALAVGWFLGWLVLNMALWPSVFGTNPWLSNGVTFWVLLVAVPALFLWHRGYRLPDFGITSTFLKGNLRVALLVGLLVGAMLITMTPGGRLIRSGSYPVGELLRPFALGFGFALIGAAIHEEFFFRAVLQTRLAAFLKSDVSGLVLATLFFAVYHLPFQYYGGRSAGSLDYALGLSLTDGVFGGLVLGVVWMRTHNLLAPVLVHALIDAISLLPRLLDSPGAPPVA
jgi:membrane protease YdiL (CAAX protease family)